MRLNEIHCGRARCLFVYELLPFSRPRPSPCSSKCADHKFVFIFLLKHVATILMPIPSTRANKIRSLLFSIVMLRCIAICTKRTCDIESGLNELSVIQNLLLNSFKSTANRIWPRARRDTIKKTESVDVVF